MKLLTTVIGGGPAGLLFCLVGRLLFLQTGADPWQWQIHLYDKRTKYLRNHRLRLDPDPYQEIRQVLNNPSFELFFRFLEDQSFQPTVKLLEEKLETLNASLGIYKDQLTIGPGSKEYTFSQLQQRLITSEMIAPDTLWTIVGADSVRSTVREMVSDNLAPAQTTHQQLARLRVEGPGLPEQLTVFDQYRLSKVLGSVCEYRLHPNQYAEVDLFLTLREHKVAAAFSAEPGAVVELDSKRLNALHAPLFQRIVEHLSHGFGNGPCRVYLQSTFRLEHAVMPTRVFRRDDLGAFVFLVGDAAVSLPFQRGMACLARSVLTLAQTHCDLLQMSPLNSALNKQQLLLAAEPVARRYDQKVDVIVNRELRIVKARSALVRGLREFVRISALVPFPIQSWFLTATKEDSERDWLTAGWFLNALVAAAAVFLAFQPVFQGTWDFSPWFYVSGLSLQAVGGLVYRATCTFESGPHRWVRTIWQAQIALWLVIGLVITLTTSMSSGTLSQVFASMLWWVGGIAFVAGMYLFEFLGKIWWVRGELDE